MHVAGVLGAFCAHPGIDAFKRSHFSTVFCRGTDIHGVTRSGTDIVDGYRPSTLARPCGMYDVCCHDTFTRSSVRIRFSVLRATRAEARFPISSEMALHRPFVPREACIRQWRVPPLIFFERLCRSWMTHTHNRQTATEAGTLMCRPSGRRRRSPCSSADDPGLRGCATAGAAIEMRV